MIANVGEDRLHNPQAAAVEEPAPPRVEALHHPLRVGAVGAIAAMEDRYLAGDRMRMPQALRAQLTGSAVLDRPM